MSTASTIRFPQRKLDAAYYSVPPEVLAEEQIVEACQQMDEVLDSIGDTTTMTADEQWRWLLARYNVSIAAAAKHILLTLPQETPGLWVLDPDPFKDEHDLEHDLRVRREACDLVIRAQYVLSRMDELVAA